MPLGNPYLLLKSFLPQIRLRCIVVVNKIKHIRAIRAEDTTNSGTILIHPEGCHARNDSAVAQEVRPARIAKAGSTSRVIIGEQQRVVSAEMDEPPCVRALIAIPIVFHPKRLLEGHNRQK